MKSLLCLVLSAGSVALAQEASSGFSLDTTLSAGLFQSERLTQPPRNGAPATAGFRSVFYPTWKLNRHWTVSGTVQLYSRPYFYEQFSTQGYGMKGDVLQANVGYTQFWGRNSLVVRAGVLSSAFGSFLLRYDDGVNPLIDMPPGYGYYYAGVSTLGLLGAQADVTLGRFDMRAQLTSSSPANRRSPLDRDQYANWAGGFGYTIRQGLRVGASAYYGPYLHREYRYFRPGESNPSQLPAQAHGLDGQWGHGHWNVYGEWQRFRMPYHAIKDFVQQTGYGEARYVFHPRWYVASRIGFSDANKATNVQVYETAVGFRPNVHQLLKVGYEVQRGPAIQGARSNVFAVQLVTRFTPISAAKD